MLVADKHGVHGRLKSNGCWELIRPIPETVEKKFLFFRWQEKEHAPLNRKEAIEIAEKHWRGGNGAYQDIVVLQENVDEEGWHDYCAVCVWQNGKWANYAVGSTNSPYRY